MKILQSVDTEKAIEMPMDKFVEYLVDEKKLFVKEQDLKLFILEYMGKAFADDSVDWPIRYYTEDEDIDQNDNSDNEEMLTDNYVQMQLRGVPLQERPEN